MPSTLMGQFMEVLNNQTNSDDLNIDDFQGGLECDVDELIKQELSIDGMLDINIPMSTHYTGSHYSAAQNTSIGMPLPQNNDATKLHSVQTSTQSAGVTSPSWVH